MKIKFFAFIILLLLSISYKAQSQSFSETLKFINEKFVCCTQSTATYKEESVQVSPQGFVTVTGYLKDENRVYQSKFNLLNLYTGKDGKFPIYNTGNHVSFDDAPQHAYTFVFKTEEIAESVKKAFIHLQKLCKRA